MERLVYLLRKFAILISSLFIIASLTFLLMKTIPGDPFSEEQALPQNIHDNLREIRGLNRSWDVQYGEYFQNVLQGNLGYSLKYPSRSVIDIIQEGLGVSAWLGVQAFLVALVFGITLGTLAAFNANRWEDRLTIILTTAGISVPSFILAALLQYTFAIHFHWLPLARWGSFSQTILPSLALAAAPMAFIARLTRSGLIEVFKTDYIKMARAKGLPTSSWLWRHGLRNALLPVLSYIGQLLANVLVGSFIIEKIFSIPGLGHWFVDSVSNRDYPLIMGLTLFYSTLLLSAVFLVDVLYVFWDPRIRLTTKAA